MAFDKTDKVEELCEYRSKFYHDYQCREKPLSYSKQGFCIFHEPEKKEENLIVFSKKIDQQIQSNKHKFIGYVFPKTVDFKEKNFIDADFSESTFKGEACFNNTTFEGMADFNRSTFEKVADFRNSTFNSALRDRTYFFNTTFEDGAFFNNSIFKGVAVFNESTFKKEAYFRDSTFEGRAEFIKSSFEELAEFSKSTFKGGANFLESTLKGMAFFRGSIFEGKASFYESTFKNIFAKKIKFKKDHYSGMMFFRSAKKIAYDQGDYVNQGYYHQREMDEIRKSQKWFSRGWSFLFQKLLHGYGEKPINVFITALSVILISSLLFSIFGIQEQTSPVLVKDCLTCLYYSVVTFTTLGYGDIQPIGITRVFAAVEALSGAFLMALFVVTFARKWKR